MKRLSACLTAFALALGLLALPAHAAVDQPAVHWLDEGIDVAGGVYFPDEAGEAEDPYGMLAQGEPDYGEFILVQEKATLDGVEVTFYGLVDAQGNSILGTRCLWIYPFREDRAVFCAVSADLETVNCGAIDPTGKVVFALNCEYIESFSDGLAKVGLPDEYGYPLFGYVDKGGKVVVEPSLLYAETIVDGVARVSLETQQGETWGLVNAKGECQPLTGLDYVGPFSEGLAMVSAGGKCGFINAQGETVVEPQYSSAGNFVGGRAIVSMEEDGKVGFIDKTGKVVVPLEYDGANDFENGYARVGKADGDGMKAGVVDAAGKVVVPTEYDAVTILDGGFAVGNRDSAGKMKIGLVNAAGEKVTDLVYDSIGAPGGGLLRVSKDGKAGFVDWSGKEVVPFRYDSANSFRDGYALVGNKDENGVLHIGLVDTQGTETIPLDYTSVGSLSEGLIRVTRREKSGYLDPKGAEVIPLRYAGAAAFSGGVAVVSQKDYDGNVVYGLVDKTGREVLPLEYTTLSRLEDGYLMVGQGSGRGLMDKNYNLVVPMEYYAVRVLPGGVGYARKTAGGQVGVFALPPVGELQIQVPTIVSTGEDPKEAGTAYASPQTILVDGQAVELQMYALKDENGDLTNYVKLRDVAHLLDGTAAQFDVTWSEEAGVGVETGKPYVSRNGSEGQTPFSGDRAYTKGPATTQVDGAALALKVFTLTDETDGGQFNYYKLRDLGQALGFNVGYDNAAGKVFLETDKPYDSNN